MSASVVEAVVKAKEQYRHDGKWVKRIVFSAACWARLKVELRVIVAYAFAEGSGPKPDAPDAEWMKVAGYVFCVAEIEVWPELPLKMGGRGADFACETRHWPEKNGYV